MEATTRSISETISSRVGHDLGPLCRAPRVARTTTVQQPDLVKRRAATLASQSDQTARRYPQLPKGHADILSFVESFGLKGQVNSSTARFVHSLRC